MIIALNNIQSAAMVRHCGRNGFVRALVLGCAMACAGTPAFAGADRDRDGQRSPPQQQSQNVNREPQRMAPAPQQLQAQPQQLQAQPQQRTEVPRQYDHRVYDTRVVDPRMEEQRRQAQQQEGAARRAPRLTPDERRELRRQINEAGTDLYPNTPRR
jgi:hypothetical protein